MSTKRRKPTALRAAARVAASSEPPKAASVASTRLDAIDAPKSTNARVDCVDAARGFAIAMMFAYHFCFDLSFFRVIHQDFYNDARWIAWRSVILSSFLLLAGIGLALAHAAANAAANPGSAANAAANPHSARWSWPRYWRRLAQIAACAALVSIGSYWVFPESWIYFGVLHHIALASVLALPLLRAPRAGLALGVAFIALGALVQHPFFDAPPWHWFGLMTFKPRTEDYVPLLPWFGVVLVGAGLGHYLAQPPRKAQLAVWHAGNAFTRALAWGGRHSLLLYMLHQPIVIGALMAVAGMPES